MPTYAYTWAHVWKHGDEELNRLGRKGWRVVPGTMYTHAHRDESNVGYECRVMLMEYGSGKAEPS